MRYLLLICGDEKQDDLPEAEMMEMMGRYGKLHEEFEKAGVLVDSDRLRPVATATTVQVRNGKTLTTDGPFAETKEQIGGYYLIDVKDLDEAIAWAAKIPSVDYGSVEVRPIWPMEEYMPA